LLVRFVRFHQGVDRGVEGEFGPGRLGVLDGVRGRASCREVVGGRGQFGEGVEQAEGRLDLAGVIDQPPDRGRAVRGKDVALQLRALVLLHPTFEQSRLLPPVQSREVLEMLFRPRPAGRATPP